MNTAIIITVFTNVTLCRTVSEIFSVKEWRDLKTGVGVVQGH